MPDEGSAHPVVLELAEPMSATTPVGSELVLQVRAACAHGCDLRGSLARVVAGRDILAAQAFIAWDSERRATDTAPFVVMAPADVGTQRWLVEFQGQATGQPTHAPVSLPLSFLTTRQQASLAIWDVPSPVIMGERFVIRVGAKSAGGCVLQGVPIDVRDEAGTCVARAGLGDSPWEGTAALYWAELEVSAPATEGPVHWWVTFPETDVPLPHAEATTRLSFACVRRPEHRVAVIFVERESQAPIGQAHVRMGLFRGVTGASGRAELLVSSGMYEIHVWHADYAALPTPIDVSGDVEVTLEGEVVPPDDDPDRLWM